MLKRIFKILMISLCFINYVYAEENDSNLVKNRYENIYAVYDAPDRVHLYYAQRYTLNDITAYCIEPGLPIDTDTYSSTEDWSIASLSSEVKNYIRLIAYYGYDYPGHDTMKYYLATQELIWRKIEERDVYWVEGSDINAPRINIDNEKNEIIALANNHTKKPSFDSKTIEVALGEEKTITDENNVLSDYEIYSSDINDVKIEGNNLKININEYKENAEIRLLKKHYTNSVALIYYSGNNQKLIRSGILDPVIASSKISINIKAKIKVTKIDKDRKFVIPKADIKFKIKNTDTGEYLCETDDCIFKTNPSGYFITDILNSGNYQIEELEDQDVYGYLWNSIPLKFSIDKNSEITYENNEPIIRIDFPNKQIKAHVRISKIGEKAIIKDGTITYDEALIDGAECKLYAAEDIYSANGNIIYRKDQKIFNIPINNGVHEILFLPLGSYCLKEISAPSNYILSNEPYCFKLEYQDRYTTEFKIDVKIKNYLAKGSFKLLKRSALTNLPLSNANIEVYTKNNELIYSGITDDNGYVSILNIPLGEYYYKETIAPVGYLMDTKKHYFEIKENEEIVNEELLNEPITGIFEFTKLDHATNLPLPDTLIEIYNNNNELLYSSRTDDEGKIIIEKMPYGKYYFIEKEAPEGYILNDEKYYFEIKENNVIVKANMTNERIPVPNTYLNENNIIYIISILSVILAILLIRNKKIFLKIISIFLLLFAVLLPAYKINKQKTFTKTTHIAISNYINNTSHIKNKSSTDTPNKPIYNYIAILEIPDIDLKQGLVNKYSKYNDVKYNIQILDESNMPNIINSNLILASHSGNSDVSYFKDLYKLNDNSLVYIYYNGDKYIYKINNHYEVLKTGYIDIERDRDINAITLITCKDDDYQIVYLGYLTAKESY